MLMAALERLKLVLMAALERLKLVYLRRSSEYAIMLAALFSFLLSPWFITGVIGFIGIYLYFSWNFNYWKENKVAHLKPYPFVGNFASRIFFRTPHGVFYESIYRKFPGEKMCGFFEGRQPVCIIRDPELMKQMFVRDFDCFADRFTMNIRPFAPEECQLLFLKGERWKNVRHITSPLFTNSKMRAMSPLVQYCSEHMLKYLDKFNGQELETKDFFARYMSDVFALVAFGIDCESLKSNSGILAKQLIGFRDFSILRRLSYYISVQIIRSPTLAKILNVRIMLEDVKKFLSDIILQVRSARENERQEAAKKGENPPRRTDFLQLMIDLQAGRSISGSTKEDVNDQIDKDSKISELNYKPSAASVINDEVLLGQSMMFLIAGFETSSTMLSCFMYEMALNPDIQERLRNETREILLQHTDKFDAIANMTYLDNVLNEVLRLHSPGVRYARFCTVPEYKIPGTECTLHEGDAVVFSVRGVHLDPEHYPDPLKFDPDRFLPENKAKRSPYAYAPFGHGPRHCIGRRISNLSTRMAALHIIVKYKIEQCPKMKVPYKISPFSDLLNFAHGMYVRVTKLDDADDYN